MNFLPQRRTKSYYKRTRKGNVLHLVEDYYLRNDIGMGIYHGDQVEESDLIEIIQKNYDRYLRQIHKEKKQMKSTKTKENNDRMGEYKEMEEEELSNLCECPFTVVLDTNTILHQIDFLEQRSDLLQTVVIPHTVMEETKNQSLSIYRRLRKLLSDKSKEFVYFPNENHKDTFVERIDGETINDRNDRSIRKVVDWYRSKLTPLTGDLFEKKHKFIMISSDVANRKLAKKEHIPTLSIHQIVKAINPALLDLLSFTGGSDNESKQRKNATVSSSSNVKQMYQHSNSAFAGMEEHIPGSLIQAGIKEGILFQGVFRSSRIYPRFCSVTVKGLNGADRVPVIINGPVHVNRAIDGDIVAIEILPPDQWIGQNEIDEGNKEADVLLLDRDEKDNQGKRNGEEKDDHISNSLLVGSVTANPKEEDITNNRITTSVKPTGRVVGIVKRNWRNYCGSILLSADTVVSSTGVGGNMSTNVLVVPADKKLPYIKITTRQRDELADKRILVAIDSWPIDSRNPIGHYVRTLGKIGDKGIETEVLLHEFDIPWEPFSEKVMACLPPPNWTITPENSKGRRDLRNIPVMSVDPPGCKDIDDALHCYRLPNGNFNVGVHIADVSYFVLPSTPLDEEAANRGTSTYLVEKRLDMLPKLLTETVCSLTDDCDHFAFSVIWEMTPEAEIVNVDFCKSIIRSIGAFSYGEAQLIKDDPYDKDSVKATSIRGLCHLARILKGKRREAGALELASPQVNFKLDSESQSPVDVQLYQLKETNSMVEEFMLLANITVGKKILRHFPLVSCLRRHPSPSQVMFDPLIAAANSVGIEIKVDDSKALQVSLDKAVKEDDAYFNSIIRILATRCMAPAQYFVSGELPEEQWHHYGLAAPIYTHFTSPIRRYADILVHRLLSAAIGVHSLPPEMEDRGSLHDICENLNRRNRAADLAGRASVTFNTVVYFRENPAMNEEAYVLRVQGDRLSTFVPRYGIEGVIKLRDENEAGMLTHDAENYTLMFNPTQVKIKVFDKVRVKITVEKKGQEDNVIVQLLEPTGFGFKKYTEDNNDAMEIDEVNEEDPIENPQKKKAKRKGGI